MAFAAKKPPPGWEGGSLELSSYGGVDGSESAPKTANLLLEAIKALSAEEICDAGDFHSAEHNRQRAREQFVEANNVFRQFQEARAADGTSFWAQAFL
jgi:hypothetical protein